MNEELMQMIPTDETESQNSNHYQDDPSFIEETQTPEAIEERLKEFQRLMIPGYLKVRSAADIYDTVYHKKSAIVEKLIDRGLVILGGAAKVGKSFFALQLAYCVSCGEEFLGCTTNQTDVIYFALEDTEARLQKRMQKMFGMEPPINLSFVTNDAETPVSYIGCGFEEQLQNTLQNNPKVGLVIIDVLQVIRNPAELSGYTTDYSFLRKLKTIAESAGICLILIHHTRKQKDNDVMNMLSGSTGLNAAVDETLILQKEHRTDTIASLTLTGRDVRDLSLKLDREPGTARWRLINPEALVVCEEAPDNILTAVSKLLSDEHPLWIGSAESLVNEAGIDMKPNALSRYLRSHVVPLEKDFNIKFSVGRTHDGRRIRLVLDGDQPLTREMIDEEGA